MTFGAGTIDGREFELVFGGVLTLTIDRPQGRVQDSAVLGDVDPFPAEHRFDPGGEIGRKRERHQVPHRPFRDQVLGVIEEQAPHFQAITFGPLRVVLEQLAHVQLLGIGKVVPQGLPGGKLGQFAHDD